MDFSIIPYGGDSPFRPFPFLSGKFLLSKNGSRIKSALFFYEGGPANPAPESAAVPVIVLIHGLGDEADSFRHIIPLLGERGCRVFALDLPGFGRSGAAGKISVKNHAGAVLRLLAAAAPGPETPVFLAGSSMGALVAEEAALRKPELIRGLILMGGSIPGGPARPGFFSLAKMLFSRKWYRAYRGNPGAAWASLYPYYADLDALPEKDKEFLKTRVMARVESASQEQAYFSTQRSLVRVFLTHSSWFARKIRAYKGKILLIWGEKDKIIPISSAEAFKTLRGGMELEIIPGAGHLPQQEKPAETARLIADFVEKNRA